MEVEVAACHRLHRWRDNKVYDGLQLHATGPSTYSTHIYLRQVQVQHPASRHRNSTQLWLLVYRCQTMHGPLV